MPRVKRGKVAHKRRKNIIKQAKGYRWGRKSKYKAAKEALFKAQTYSYRDRRRKKRDMRRLWNTKINAACRQNNTTYRELIYCLKKEESTLNRKVMAELAEHHPDTFSLLIKEVIK